MRWHQLASDLFAFYDDSCTVYALRYGDCALVVDFATGRWLEHLDEIGVRHVEHVVLTHAHRDRCCGLYRTGLGDWTLHAPAGDRSPLGTRRARRILGYLPAQRLPDKLRSASLAAARSGIRPPRRWRSAAGPCAAVRDCHARPHARRADVFSRMERPRRCVLRRCAPGGRDDSPAVSPRVGPLDWKWSTGGVARTRAPELLPH